MAKAWAHMSEPELWNALKEEQRQLGREIMFGRSGDYHLQRAKRLHYLRMKKYEDWEKQREKQQAQQEAADV